jgi:glutathione peroxidase
MATIYDFTVKTNDGKPLSLATLKGKVVLIVNTATHCGYTPQYKGLEELYQRFKNKGLVILDFPSNTFLQAPEDNEGIAQFCSRKYQTSFPLMAKVHVNGPDSEPLYAYLRSSQEGGIDVPIRWNFSKFLINKDGTVIGRYDSKVTPEMLTTFIEPLL